MKAVIFTERGRKAHIFYRFSRFTPGRAIANCGKVGYAMHVDDADEFSWCKHCQKGPTQLVLRTDPRRNPNDVS